MLKILLQGHEYKYEISEFLKLFTSEFSFLEGSEDFDVNGNDILIVNELFVGKNEERIDISTNTRVLEGEKEVFHEVIDEQIDLRKKEIAEKIRLSNLENGIKKPSISEKKFAINEKKLDNMIKTISKRIIQRSMFRFLKSKFDVNVPWGILTGIRPVKIVHSLLDEEKDEYEIKKIMKKEYLLNDEKMDLIYEIACLERPYIYPTSEDKVSLYVSIPFCPTRCLYCSFPSHKLSEFGHLRHQYVLTLLKEANAVSKILNKNDKEIESLYIGGGTPTSLCADDLDFLISELFKIMDLSKIKEFTVEAGRPDTITEEKLLVLKKHKVSRISINPQTMNQSTLDVIGRNHTVDEIVTCYNMARDIGFNNINMDLILGLPGETPEMVESTMKKIVSMNPESITVHTLALKRASDLKINVDDYKNALTTYNNMIEMIDISKKYMKEHGYLAYYMYRQKHMLGNLENVGYAKKGFECLYNMQIMEERQSNYAIGAGSVSKFVYPKENRIERVDDVKNIDHYINRIDEMIDKKYREVEKNDDRGA